MHEFAELAATATQYVVHTGHPPCWNDISSNVQYARSLLALRQLLCCCLLPQSSLGKLTGQMEG